MSLNIKRNIICITILLLFICVNFDMLADSSYAASKKIHLKKATVSLIAGKTYQQKLIDKKGKTIKATKVKWKSKKTSIAKINKKGKITAVKAGTAKMTAKYKGKTYSFTVKVSDPSKEDEKPTNPPVSVSFSQQLPIYLTGETSNCVIDKYVGPTISEGSDDWKIEVILQGTYSSENDNTDFMENHDLYLYDKNGIEVQKGSIPYIKYKKEEKTFEVKAFFFIPKSAEGAYYIVIQ